MGNNYRARQRKLRETDEDYQELKSFWEQTFTDNVNIRKIEQNPFIKTKLALNREKQEQHIFGSKRYNEIMKNAKTENDKKSALYLHDGATVEEGLKFAAYVLRKADKEIKAYITEEGKFDGTLKVKIDRLTKCLDGNQIPCETQYFMVKCNSKGEAHIYPSLKEAIYDKFN